MFVASVVVDDTSVLTIRTEVSIDTVPQRRVNN